jgi:hypothetical protein
MSADDEGNVGMGITRGKDRFPVFDMGFHQNEEMRIVLYGKDGKPRAL